VQLPSTLHVPWSDENVGSRLHDWSVVQRATQRPEPSGFAVTHARSGPQAGGGTTVVPPQSGQTQMFSPGSHTAPYAAHPPGSVQGKGSRESVHAAVMTLGPPSPAQAESSMVHATDMPTHWKPAAVQHRCWPEPHAAAASAFEQDGSVHPASGVVPFEPVPEPVEGDPSPPSWVSSAPTGVTCDMHAPRVKKVAPESAVSVKRKLAFAMMRMSARSSPTGSRKVWRLAVRPVTRATPHQ
jgi:hypothetical protein